MSSSLTEDYLRWLEPQIRDSSGRPDKSYWDLMQLMFQKEFRVLVPYDENRVGDGLELRNDFCYEHNLRAGSLSYLGPCSFLEVLIGLSRRLAFQASGAAPGWACQFLTNLELNKMTDPLTRRKIRLVDEILDTVIWRKYEPDGSGGFFPLAWPDEDQTQKELWYQMQAYIDELHPEHR